MCTLYDPTSTADGPAWRAAASLTPLKPRVELSNPANLVHTSRGVAGRGPQLGMDGEDLKNLGHALLLLFAVVGHLSQHHLQKRED